MVVHILLKDTSSFKLEKVERMGIMKHLWDGRYRRMIWFRDEVHGVLAYPLTDIVELVMEG